MFIEDIRLHLMQNRELFEGIIAELDQHSYSFRDNCAGNLFLRQKLKLLETAFYAVVQVILE